MFYRALSWLPFPVLYAAAWLAYLVIYYIAGYRKAVVRTNLEHAFPEKSEREITVLAKKCYRHLCRVAFEIFKARRMSQDDFRERVKFVNEDVLARASNNYQDSVIVLTIHQGNWEWMLHGATTALNIPIDPVYKPLHNKAVDELVYTMRSQFGSRPLAMADAPKDILRRRREFRIFVMVADQAPIRSERSHWLSFMNREAAFYVGAEAIAKMTRFPVVFAQCRCSRPGYYDIEFHDVATPPYEKDSHRIIERYVALAEQAIHEQPHTWLWTNRRWKRNRQAEAARAEAEAENTR